MIVFARRADHWNGKWFYVTESKVTHGPIRRLLGSYHYQPAWLLFSFPIWRDRWIKVMFVQFWRQGHYE